MKATTDQYKEWEARITSFQSSGQTIAAWCRSHDLKVHQLKYWLQKQKSKRQPATNPAQWLAVDIKNPETKRNDLPLLVKVGPAAIEVYPGFNAELLLDVVRTLSATC